MIGAWSIGGCFLCSEPILTICIQISRLLCDALSMTGVEGVASERTINGIGSGKNDTEEMAS